VVEETLSSLGTSESGDHVCRGCECVGEASVLETGGVGGDNVDAVDEAGPANLPEDL
jgi:hypothetical protein